MATTPAVLVQSKSAEDSQTTQYTAPSLSTVFVDSMVLHNSTGGAVTFAANVVPSGGSADSTNLFLNRSIPAGASYLCPEIAGRTLAEGDFISTLAGAASSLSIRIEGRVIS